MKKFIRTLQMMSERAAEVQEAIQRMPPKVAGIREAMTMTTGQLQQLQSDVQKNVASLKADSQDRLIAALHEINGSHEVFQEAGYELGQVEMELSPVPRLIVHLNRVNDVRDSMLRSLVDANQGSRITHALLNSVMQAEAMADQVDIQGQVYYKLIVHIGPVPAVRLSWMPEVDYSASTPRSAAPMATPAPGFTGNAISTYGKESFFATHATRAAEPPPEAPVAESQEDSVEAAPAPSSALAPVELPAASSVPTRSTSRRARQKDWGAASLERFKKMPSVSKYR